MCSSLTFLLFLFWTVAQNVFLRDIVELTFCIENRFITTMALTNKSWVSAISENSFFLTKSGESGGI